MGFMGSGKSTVGPLLADRLGWTFVDVDREVEEADGRSIPEIFRQDGETAFREVEHRLTLDTLAGDELVVSTGGGWPCRDDRMEGLPEGTFSVWLNVSVEVAVERARAEGDTRPLLSGPDPVGAARELLEQREPFYRKADCTIDAGAHDPEEVVALVTECLRDGRQDDPPNDPGQRE